MDEQFEPYEFAYEKFSETINYMSDSEIEEIGQFDNENELREYMSQFYERT